MSDFSSKQPFNNQQGNTQSDSAPSIFSAAYLDGVPLDYEAPLPPNTLAQVVDDSTSELDDPNWVTEEAAPPPSVKSSGPSNGRWYYWTGAKSLTVQLHNNEGILAVWFPQEPAQPITIQSGQGASGGIGIYTTIPFGTSGEQVAAETVAIPSGHESLTLTATAQFPTPILVLVSGEPYPPSKTFLGVGVTSEVFFATVGPEGASVNFTIPRAGAIEVFTSAIAGDNNTVVRVDNGGATVYLSFSMEIPAGKNMAAHAIVPLSNLITLGKQFRVTVSSDNPNNILVAVHETEMPGVVQFIDATTGIFTLTGGI